MIDSCTGYTTRPDTTVHLFDRGKVVCRIRTRKFSDAMTVAQIVATILEIDEITETKTNAQ